MGEIRFAAVVVVALGLVAVGAAGAVDGQTGAGAADALGVAQTNTTATNTTNGTATGTVAGTVTNESGSAVANATVTVGSATTTTNASGAYGLTVQTGTYTLTVSVGGEQVATRSVNVTANTTTTADVTVAVTATITGTVTDSDGDPISSVFVDLRQPGGFENTAGFPDEYVARTQPADDGSYELRVDPGEYDIGAGSVAYELDVYNVSLSPGETLTRNFTLDRAAGGIRGRVTDRSGTPIENATVTTLNGTMSSTTDSLGFYDLTLPAGTYTVVADADGYQPTRREVGVQAGRTTALDVALTARNSSESPLAVTITGTSGPVAPGETLAVGASVTNSRNEAVSQRVTLVVNETTVDDTLLSVPAGATRSVTLVWTAGTDASGSYTATVRSGDASASTVLTVDPSLNVSDGSGGGGTDGSSGGGTDGGTNDGGNSSFLTGNQSDDSSGPSFGTGNESSGDLFGGIGNESDSFDGFGKNSSSAPTFGFGNETDGAGFEFESGVGGSGFGFDTDSGESLFDFGSESGGSGFGFGTDSDGPTFDFSPD